MPRTLRDGLGRVCDALGSFRDIWDVLLGICCRRFASPENPRERPWDYPAVYATPKTLQHGLGHLRRPAKLRKASESSATSPNRSGKLPRSLDWCGN